MLYEITLSDGRTVTVRANSPEEARAEIERMLDEEVSATPAQAAQTAAPQATPMGQAPMPAAPTPLSEASAALTRGGAPYAAAAGLGALVGAPIGGVGAIPGAAAGMGAMALTQFVGDPLVDSVNALFGTKLGTPSEALQTLMDAAGLAKPQTAAGRVGQTAVETAAGGAGGAALGRTLERIGGPITREVGRVLGQAPIAQTISGGAGGAAAQTVAEAGGGPVEQMAAGMTAGTAAGGLASRAAGATMDGQAPLRADIAEAERRGIRVLTSDVRPPNSFITGNVRRIGESIPIAGTAGIRVAQERERIDAVRNTLQSFGVAADDIPDDLLATITADLRGNRANMIRQLRDQKMNIIRRYSSDQRPVPARGALAFIDAEINRLRGISEANEPVVQALLMAQRDLTAPKALEQVEELRRVYRTFFADPRLANVRDIGDASMERLYNAVRDDMANYIRGRGGQQAEDIWRNANTMLAQMMDDLRNTGLKTALNRGDITPELVRPLLFSRNTSDLVQLYDDLTPAGRATARQAILRHALQRAGNIDDPTIFNANTFERELGRLENQLRLFFPGNHGAEIDGLRRALRLTSQATTTAKAAAAPTGLQILPTAVGGVATQLAGNLVGGGLLLGGAGLITRLYESAATRNLLARLGRVRPGTPEEAELLKRLNTAITAEQRVEEPPR